MKTRAGLLLTCATGALLIGAGLTTQARAADFPVKAVPPVDLGWWFHGDVEVGGRFFVKKEGGPTTCLPSNVIPGFNCTATRESLGKFYEYRDWRPGPFGNVIMAAGSNDGLYAIGFWANNIGYDDQSYFLTFDKAGEHYLSLGWDSTPHVYNDNATTVFGGVGTADLTLPNAFRTTLFNNLTPSANPVPTTAAQRLNIANAIQRNLNEFELGFQRDTAAVEYRWTPTDNWDVKVDYARTRRDGTQPMGALALQGTGAGGAARIALELPKPIADTTDNANGSVEYIGVTPWGKKFNIAAGYGASIYRNENSAVRFQHPFVPDGGNSGNNPLWNQIALAPDNTASMFRMNGGIDLPWQSRYTSAVQYSIAQQNETFLPFTINPAVVPGVVLNPVTAFPTISQNSLNGESDILLINNVLTTQMTSNLKSTLRYRYYDYSNQTPDTTIAGWIFADTLAAEAAAPAHIARGTSYVKQNASGDLVWNPIRWLTVGSGVAWERWDRDHRDVNVTDELTGKVFVTAKPWEMTRFRASYLHSERRYDSYEPEVASNAANAGRSTYRLFDMADRNRDKGNFYIDFYLPANVTVTPTGGFRFDDYGTNPYALSALDINGVPRGELGLLHDNAYNAGIEVAWAPFRDMNFIASYIHEDSRRQIMANVNTAMLDVHANDRANTFMFGTNVVIVPERLDVKAAVTYSKMRGTLEQAGGGIAPFAGTIGTAPLNAFNGRFAFPDQQIAWTRFDVQSKYKFDPVWVQQMGFKGEVYAKLRYVWEHNTVDDWSAVNQNYLVLFSNGLVSDPYRKSIFMGWDNPNYNVQMLMASVGFKW